VALAHASTLAEHLVLIVHGALLRVSEDPVAALAVVDRAEALLGDEPQCRLCSLDYYLAAASVCAGASDLARGRAFLGRVEEVAALWNGGPWAPAAAEAPGGALAAPGGRGGGGPGGRRGRPGRWSPGAGPPPSAGR